MSDDTDDRFRRQHRPLTDEEKVELANLKAEAEVLAARLDRIGGREGATALTKLEECVMWATKGLTA